MSRNEITPPEGEEDWDREGSLERAARMYAEYQRFLSLKRGADANWIWQKYYALCNTYGFTIDDVLKKTDELGLLE